MRINMRKGRQRRNMRLKRNLRRVSGGGLSELDLKGQFTYRLRRLMSQKIMLSS